MNKLVTWIVWVLIVFALATGAMLAIRDCGVKHHETEGFQPGLPPP